MDKLTVETEDALASVHELAANNDVEGFKRCVERDPSCADDVAQWYGRRKGTNHMVSEERTPLMVAATYGSLDVIKLILSLPDADVNRSCGVENTTALHCAASGGAPNSVDVVKLLLAAGADPASEDANGRRPADVIVVQPKLNYARCALEELIKPNLKTPLSPARKEYPIDPSIPDIKNSVYSTDEFRMYSFKVRPCSRAYSHDWTECPFVHPGENARRRDPRKFHYSCVPCPDFRKGACRRGDMCEYAHGVFECWLHPAQYRTRLCKDGTSCARRVCFFAHTAEELRPLYVSTTPTAMDYMPSSPNGLPSLPLNLQSSRLRASLNARDFPAEEFDIQQLNDFSGISRSGRLTLDDSLSPLFPDQGFSQTVYSPTHKSAVLGMLSPGSSFASSRMSPRSMEAVSPFSSRASLMSQKQQFRSLSSRELGSNVSPVPWARWGSSNGRPDWSVSADELEKLRNSSSYDDEPDFSWVQSLVKESPAEESSTNENPSDGQGDVDAGWIDQLQIDQVIAR